MLKQGILRWKYMLDVVFIIHLFFFLVIHLEIVFSHPFYIITRNWSFSKVIVMYSSAPPPSITKCFYKTSSLFCQQGLLVLHRPVRWFKPGWMPLSRLQIQDIKQMKWKKKRGSKDVRREQRHGAEMIHSCCGSGRGPLRDYFLKDDVIPSRFLNNTLLQKRLSFKVWALQDRRPHWCMRSTHIYI